jgi:ribosomal protein S18 acetylase RimI-like enzyme
LVDSTVVSRPSSGSLRVRPLTEADAPFAANLHAEALPNGIIARLGRRGLRAYYRGFARSPHAIAWLAEREAPVGMVVGTADISAHRRWVRRHHATRLALPVAGALVRHPVFVGHFSAERLARLVRTRRRRGRAPSRRASSAVLSHVAVSAQARGSGAGTALVEAFAAAAQRAGANTVELVSPLDGGAVEFYDTLGWRRVAETVGRDGRQLMHFELVLDSGGS